MHLWLSRIGQGFVGMSTQQSFVGVRRMFSQNFMSSGALTQKFVFVWVPNETRSPRFGPQPVHS